MNLLSSFASWFEGNSASVAFALIGGFIVACGLGIEKIAEILDNRFLGGYNAHKKLEWFGWSVLMFGIWIEIADAGWTAHEIKQAERMAIKNDPLNLPLSDLTADVSIRIKGVPDDSPSPYRRTMAVMALFKEDSHECVNLSEFGILVAYKSDFQEAIWNANSSRQSKQYLLHFHKMDAIDDGLEYELSHPLPGVLIVRPVVRDVTEQVVNVEISTWFIPHDAEIEGGAMTLLANGSIPKYFIIPPQKAFPPPRGLGWTAQNPGFTLFATNSLAQFLTREGIWP